MDTGSNAGTAPAAASGNSDVLTVVEEEFENIYDAPYIIVNRIDGDIVALVEGDPEDGAATQARIDTAVEKGEAAGGRFYAAEYGDVGPNFITIFFAPATDGEV